LVPIILSNCSSRSVVVDDGVGHERVEAPVPRLHVLEQRVHRRGDPGVRPGARGLGPDLRDGFIEPGLIAARNNDCSACRYEFFGDRRTDPSRTAGDNGDLAFQ
jgi:hypothetical protein